MCSVRYVTLVEASEIERKFSKMYTIKQAVNDKSTTPNFSFLASQQTSFPVSLSNVPVFCPCWYYWSVVVSGD